MNTFTKSLFLLAFIVLASGQDIQAKLSNLRGMIDKSAAANAANLAKLDSLMKEVQNKKANNGNQNQSAPTPAPAEAAPAPAEEVSAPVEEAAPVQETAAPAETAPVKETSAPATPKASGSALFTLEQLQEMMPNSGENSAKYYDAIINALTKGDITSCPRMASFLAQIGHESGSLVYTTEIADGSNYEGIADIGNTSPGDGVRYKGRGVIQVTGKYNYQIVSEGLGYDFVSDPEELANAPWCIDSAVWWWNNHTLSPIADGHTQESFDQVTRIINGGYNGKADRDSRWAVTKRVLGC
jgi:predicted chitinase